MTSRPETFESSSYREICGQILEKGRQRFGPGGYERIVFTNGCFDILHAGHLKVLDHCRSVAGPKGSVVVGVNSDASIRRIKGNHRPVMDERNRCLLLVHLKPVDHVVTFEEDTPIDLIHALLPDVIVKGGDYRSQDVVGGDVGLVMIVPTEDGISSTSIIERIKEHG